MNIIIATNSNILIYNLEDNIIKTLEGKGDYYETLINDTDIITISNTQFKKHSYNYLKIFDNKDSKLFKIEGSNINSLIKSTDNKFFYYTSSNTGMLFKYNIKTLQLEENIQLGNDKKKIGSIALKKNFIYVAIEYNEISDVCIYDISNNYNKIKTYKRISYNIKNIVFWSTGFLFLNSDNAELCFFNENTQESLILFSFNFIKDCKIFLSGLFVINNFAFIGVNYIATKFNHSSGLACVDLSTNRIIWLKKINTKSYINSITFSKGYKYLTNKIKNMFIKFPGIFKYEETKMIRRIGYYPSKELYTIFSKELSKELSKEQIIKFLYTNSDYSKFYQTIYFKKYQKYIRDIIRYIFGTKKIGNIVTCYLVLFKRGYSKSINNMDKSIESDRKYHRIYLSLHSNNKMLFNFFNSKWESFNINKGEIVEFNNNTNYSITNKGNNDCMYLVIDYSKKIINKSLL